MILCTDDIGGSFAGIGWLGKKSTPQFEHKFFAKNRNFLFKSLAGLLGRTLSPLVLGVKAEPVIPYEIFKTLREGIGGLEPTLEVRYGNADNEYRLPR